MAVALGDTRMADGITPGLHHFFLPRKKRKDDGASDNAWYHQLKAAADGIPLAQASEVGSATAANFDRARPTQQQETKQGVISAPDATATASELPSRGSQAEIDLSASTPRKMLKIRSDGKLSSPKVRKSDPNGISRRKPVSSRSADVEKSKIIIIKYGINNGRRSLLGEKIHGILARPNPTPKNEKRSTMSSPPDQVDISKPTIPPVPTHPFFLAKPAQATKAGVENQKEKWTDSSIPAGESKKNSSPSKVTSVNKIIRRLSCPDSSGLVNRPAGSSYERVARHAGLIEALWPPQGMNHISSLADEIGASNPQCVTPTVLRRLRKLKDASVHVREAEDILRPHKSLTHFERIKEHGDTFSSSLRKPVRRLMTDLELQFAISRSLKCDPTEDELNHVYSSTTLQYSTHHALRHLYDRIANSTTAFDRFGCETREWVHKYAPTTAEDVLQPGREATILRDWLKSLTINAVEKRVSEVTGVGDALESSKRNGKKVKRKRRKRAQELDGFVISSDEEADQMDDIATTGELQSVDYVCDSSKKSLIRTGDTNKALTDLERPANAVVISGPHGCGKTAAVHAVAQELGFEVFEINPGSRRSGKDLLDRIGDMTKNHLVNHNQEDSVKETNEDTEDMMRVTDSLQKDLESGRQGTMNKFFQPQAGTKNKATAKPRGRPSKKEAPAVKPDRKPLKVQKQSLILLEEVDILFEDDKQFWSTTLDLILRSRRPVIMTCTEESLIPLEEMVLFAILRFAPPPNPLATDYLLLLACNEGHLLSRDSVAALYRAKRKDLRASIAELNFFCQMAIGDTKGGLEWLLIRSSSGENKHDEGKKLRVVSEATYPHGLGWISQDYCPQNKDQSFEAEAELVAEVLHGWDLDLVESENFLPLDELREREESSLQLNLSKLQRLDHMYEALSAADICAPLGQRRDETMILDPTQPEIPEKARSDYVEGAALLQADPKTDFTGTSTSLAIAIRLLARRLSPAYNPLTPTSIIHQLPMLLEKSNAPPHVTAADMRAAFTPLSNIHVLSSFTTPDSTLAVDLAPFIRSITAYDLRLENQRRRLDDLLSASQSGAGDTRNVKRVRTTRASRAALEGGAKATTRRERWFPTALNFSAVARTGGKTWGEVAFSRLHAADIGSEGRDIERGVSIGSGKSSDD
ncbi:MAG: hypothetical protein Q9195_007399 [Heterodermia aff. obscurata]